MIFKEGIIMKSLTLLDLDNVQARKGNATKLFTIKVCGAGGITCFKDEDRF